MKEIKEYRRCKVKSYIRDMHDIDKSLIMHSLALKGRRREWRHAADKFRRVSSMKATTKHKISNDAVGFKRLKSIWKKLYN